LAPAVQVFEDNYTDPETGLIYLNHRYYDPSTAEFITRDPLVAISGSTYGYVNDNPLNDTDPTGLCSSWNAVCDASKGLHAAGQFIGQHHQVIGNVLDAGAAVAGTVALVTDATGVGAVVGIPAGVLAGEWATAAAAIHCEYDSAFECAKAVAIAGLTVGTLGAGGLFAEAIGHAAELDAAGLEAMKLFFASIHAGVGWLPFLHGDSHTRQQECPGSAPVTKV
jgi:RHS repeat-associated protein